MAEDKTEPREINWRQLLPWTAIFQGFRVALDPNKLVLAALGILAMAVSWWVLAAIFFSAYSKPNWPDATWKNDWTKFKESRDDWNLMVKAAAPADYKELEQPEDLADNELELYILRPARDLVDREAAAGRRLEDIKGEARIGKLKVAIETPDGQKIEHTLTEEQAGKAWQLVHSKPKPTGYLRTWPWYEDRGSNPYMLVTGQAGVTAEDGTRRTVPWVKGQFVEWLITEQVPVLLEPLVKMLRPVIYFFNPHAGWLTRFYFLLVMIVTVAIWGLVGGAITRIAAVQVARQEKIGAREAFRFAVKRYLSFISAPLFPLILVAFIVLAMIIFGIFFLIPILGDVVGGLLWFLMILAGLGIMVVLVGLVGWPLMAATISTEGTDSWEAVSRSYSYVYGAPWHYIFYGTLALLYGAVLVFFVGFIGSGMVRFAKFGVEQTPFIHAADRDPSFLFVYAPTSYDWRPLLLEGATVNKQPVVVNGEIKQRAYDQYVGRDPAYDGPDRLKWWNHIGASIVMLWLWLMFLLVLGFGYSYFWTASTIVYLLLRRKVDDTEMDEVYLEEEDQEGPYSTGAPFAPPKPASPAPAPANVTMLEAPTLRTPPKEEKNATALQESPPVAPPAQSSDGNPPAAEGGSPP
jgi:hypothetical protein